ncbi:MAG: winged helix DNA-binding domain-containing protein [Brevefilum sp.]|nr:winged helix DNA-binding domain-containing protein [Brevefilum sp.]
MHLTEATARSAMLAAQGLLTAPSTPASKEGLLGRLRKMGYLQIDTIQAVRRSQYLVLWSRFGDYEPAWLDELHASGCLFEYYAHALCYLPIEDYPIFRGLILHDEHTGNGWGEWAQENQDIIRHVRSVIKEKGPVCSADFDSATISTGWGDVKQEKLALTRMFYTGELMVTHRTGFRRYYDLRERVLPDWEDVQALDRTSAYQALILKAVRALGVARQDWIAPYFYLRKTGLTELLDELAAEGQIERVLVEAWDLPAYIHPDHLDMVQSAGHGELIPTHTTLLSPFDPLVSDRERALAVFGFDYRMESYTPAKDRQYGYFCLPILHQGELVGRLDPKAHRREKRMEIKNIILEPGTPIDDALADALKDTLAEFSQWHGMTTCEVISTDPPELGEALS